MQTPATYWRRAAWLGVGAAAYLALILRQPSGWTALVLSLLVAGLAVAAYRRTRVDRLRTPPRWPRAVVLLFLAYAALFAGRLVLLALIDWAWPGLLSEDMTYHVLRTFDLPALLVLVVSSPVIEESIFRGVLFDLVPSKSPLAGVVLTSTVFAGMHWLTLGDPAVIGPAWWLGTVLAILRAVTGGIELPIALHALNNLIGELVGLR